MQCFRCRGWGHAAAECPTPEHGGDSTNYCYDCGGCGHFARDHGKGNNGSKGKFGKDWNDGEGKGW